MPIADHQSAQKDIDDSFGFPENQIRNEKAGR